MKSFATLSVPSDSDRPPLFFHELKEEVIPSSFVSPNNTWCVTVHSGMTIWVWSWLQGGTKIRLERYTTRLDTSPLARPIAGLALTFGPGLLLEGGNRAPAIKILPEKLADAVMAFIEGDPDPLQTELVPA